MTRSYRNIETLLVSGSIAQDVITVVAQGIVSQIRESSHPQISLSYLLNDDDVKTYRGGTGSNIAYSLGLNGVPAVLLGSIGESDTTSLPPLEAIGVNTQYVHRSKFDTASFRVITDRDNNQIATFYPGAMQDSSSLSLNRWNDKNAFLILSPHDPRQMRIQVAECQKYNIPYAYDFGQQVINLPAEDLSAGVDNASVLIANDFEMKTLSERIKRPITEIKAAVGLFITTLGKDGAIIEGADVTEPILIPAAPVEKVVDPTGAGDAWRAGFFAGLFAGQSLSESGLRGALTAAYAIQQKGAQEHKFSPGEFEAQLQKNRS